MVNAASGSKLSSYFIGGLLVALGIVFLAGQYFAVNLERIGWPFFVIVPGVLVCALALAAGGRAGEGFFMFGSLVTMAGLILLYQNSTDHFESWAYAWALVAPTSVGLGQIVYGSLHGFPEMVRSGLKVTKVGLIIFVAGAVFFELVLNIGGFGFNEMAGYTIPALLIIAGVAILVSRFMPRGQTAVAAPVAAAPAVVAPAAEAASVVVTEPAAAETTVVDEVKQ